MTIIANHEKHEAKAKTFGAGNRSIQIRRIVLNLLRLQYLAFSFFQLRLSQAPYLVVFFFLEERKKNEKTLIMNRTIQTTIDTDSFKYTYYLPSSTFFNWDFEALVYCYNGFLSTTRTSLCNVFA